MMKRIAQLLFVTICFQACSSNSHYDGIYRASTPYKDYMVIVQGEKLTFIDSEKGEKQYTCNQSDKGVHYQTYDNDVVRQLTVDQNKNLMLNNEVTLNKIK